MKVCPGLEKAEVDLDKAFQVVVGFVNYLHRVPTIRVEQRNERTLCAYCLIEFMRRMRSRMISSRFT